MQPAWGYPHDYGNKDSEEDLEREAAATELEKLMVLGYWHLLAHVGFRDESGGMWF